MQKRHLLRLLAAILTAALPAVLGSCSLSDEPDAPTPVHRTVLVYMAANNSLGQNGYDIDDNGNMYRRHAADTLDIEEMRTAALAGDLQGGRLILYHADANGLTVLQEVMKDGSLRTIKTYSDGLSSVHKARMSAVIDDAKKAAPADEYGIILWSHGDGWLQNGIDESAQSPRKRAFGYEKGRKMNITTLAEVLRGKGLSFIYFDCCYMATVEVAYELRGCAPVMTASATELLADGMPYDRNLRLLFRPEGADIAGAATNTFNFYDSKKGDNRTCTVSVIDLEAMDRLAEATRTVYEKAGELMPAGYSPQAFSLDSPCYYYDFADYVKALCGDDAQAYARWREVFDSAVTMARATPFLYGSLSLDRHNGLSTYIIRSTSAADTRSYTTTSWYADVVSVMPALRQ